MFPVDEAVYESGVSQPLLYINSYNFQWAENVSSMMKLATPHGTTGTFVIRPRPLCVTTPLAPLTYRYIKSVPSYIEVGNNSY